MWLFAEKEEELIGVWGGEREEAENQTGQLRKDRFKINARAREKGGEGRVSFVKADHLRAAVLVNTF